MAGRLLHPCQKSSVIRYLELGWLGEKDQVKIMIVLCLVFQQQGRVILSWNRDENKKLNFTWNSSDVKGAVGTDLSGLMYEKLVAEKLDAVKLWCIETMM